MLWGPFRNRQGDPEIVANDEHKCAGGRRNQQLEYDAINKVVGMRWEAACGKLCITPANAHLGAARAAASGRTATVVDKTEYGQPPTLTLAR